MAFLGLLIRTARDRDSLSLFLPRPPSPLPISTTKPTKPQGKKEKIEDILSLIPPHETVIFDPLPVPNRRTAQLCLPSNIDILDPYAVFSLFWPESLWSVISTNTNMYAVHQRLSNQDTSTRPWWGTSPAEIKVFVGALIYMGVNPIAATEKYWRIQKDRPIHRIADHISLTRFQQIKRYLHVSPVLHQNVWEPKTPEEEEAAAGRDPDGLNKQWWNKLEPLASTFRSACQRYYLPSSEVAIDELMIRCFGRSQHTYKMPNKPIKQGYKLFALADHGYVWWFQWSSRKHGIAELVLHPELTPTGSMVLQIVKKLPSLPQAPFIVYLDNYFTSIALFKLLRDLGYGACGTTRPNNSKDEMPKLLKDLKEHYGKLLPWNTIAAIPVRNDRVLALAWQDNNVVLALSTVHTVHSLSDYVERERRCPSKTSTNAPVVRKAFGNEAVKKMPIPRFIDDYNYHMGGVDIANQYRQSYETHQKAWRNWICVFTWILDQAIINSYRVMYTHLSQKGVNHRRIPTSMDWREELYEKLFAFSNDPSIRHRHSKLPSVRMDTTSPHTRVIRPRRSGCAQCRLNMAARKRQKLENGGSITTERASQTNSGCGWCDVALCRQGSCWSQFHGGIA